MTPNPDQQKAIALFLDWLNDPDARYFELDGKAGTGKTWTLIQCLKRSRLTQKQVVLAAPVNKAVFVLQAELFNAGLPRYNCKTIHSVFGITVSEYDEDGSPIFDTKRGRLENPDLRLLIIDEKSMIGSEVLEVIANCSDPSLKILLSGDSYQLPPVVKQCDRILSHEDYEARNFKDDFTLSPSIGIAGKYTACLTQIMRQDEGNSISMLSEIRDVIEEADNALKDIFESGECYTFNPSLDPFHSTYMVEDETLVNLSSFNRLLEKACELFSQGIRAKAIAYTNKSAILLEKKIFQKLYPGVQGGYPEGCFVQLNDHWRNGTDSIIVPSGCEGFVKSSKLHRSYFLGSSLDYYDLVIDFGNDIGEIPLKASLGSSTKRSFDILKSSISRSGKFYPDSTIKGIYESLGGEFEGDSNATIESALALGSHEHTEYGSMVVDLIKASIVTLSWKEGWGLFYRLGSMFADLKYGYSSTVHKAQGSTYDRVLFYNDLRSFQLGSWEEVEEGWRQESRGQDPRLSLRLLYVACSRHKECLYFAENQQ